MVATATWPGMGSTPAVRADTLITPPPAVASPRNSNLAIQVTGPAPANAIQDGLPLTIQKPDGSAVTCTTDSNGCVFLACRPQGSYTVTLDQAGYADNLENQSTGARSMRTRTWARAPPPPITCGGHTTGVIGPVAWHLPPPVRHPHPRQPLRPWLAAPPGRGSPHLAVAQRCASFLSQLNRQAAPARSAGQLPKGFLLLTGIPPGMVVEGDGCWGFALEAAGLAVADGAGGEAADDEWWSSLDQSR